MYTALASDRTAGQDTAAVSARLAAIEERLDEIIKRLDDLNTNILAALDHVQPDRDTPPRSS
jgi:hypothetical protein